MRATARLGLIGVAGIVALAIAIQAVPYGRAHANPAIRAEPPWNSPITRELAVRACYDCHSNQTVWPWYTNVAPASWLVQSDVERGRRHLNFSEWDRPQRDARDAAEQVQKGEMPPMTYTPIHPEARLSASEKSALISGLQATFGSGGGNRGRQGDTRREPEDD